MIVLKNLVFKNAVRNYRKLLKVSQDHLALVAGVSQGQLSDIELGRCGCNVDTALRIHMALKRYFSVDFPDKHLYFEDLFFLVMEEFGHE